MNFIENLSTCTLSVIIPVYNAAGTLKECLDALVTSDYQGFECIIVDDGSTDESMEIARRYPAQVVGLTEGPSGPAHARNIGARAAQGKYLFFVDADVVIRKDTLARITLMFEQNPELAALFGSYDDDPSDGGLLSQYKNLAHHFVHQQASREASTFWSGCGAIRRDIFLQIGGFDVERYPRPSIEDIELGRRLKRAGHRILLDDTLQVKHLKRWTVLGWLKTDIRDRAIPWTRLILEENYLPDDLNVGSRQRWSAVLAAGLIFILLVGSMFSHPVLLAILGILYFLAIPAWYWRAKQFSYRPNAGQALGLVACASIFIAISIFWARPVWVAVMIILVGDLGLAVLLTRSGRLNQSVLFVIALVAFNVSIFSLLLEGPLWLVGLALFLVALIIGLNQAFFRFFIKHRGLFFAIAVFPFQVLYYLYSLAAFVLAGGLHIFDNWSKSRRASSTDSSQRL